MTISELFLQISEQLQRAGCDSPAFDACCLLEDFAGLSHAADPRVCFDAVSFEQEMTVCAAANRRASGEPLQYILGEWDFLSLTLNVGSGVLIPRADTEILCETVAMLLRSTANPRVLDLCAGSGCVGLGIASLCDSAQVTAVELSDDALWYLRRNTERYGDYDVKVVQDDVLCPQERYGVYDAIVSNPPYIPSADIDGLMREVQHEPRMALDGDEDGLRFYRAIVSHWTAHLTDGGWLVVEIGIGQESDVKALMEAAGLHNVQIAKDYAGIDRVVYGQRIKS